MPSMSPSSFFDPALSPTATEAVNALSVLANSPRAEGMSSYMRGKFEFFGIASTPRKQAVAPILSGKKLDWDFVQALWAHPVRECQYVAVDHLRRQKLSLQDLDQLKVLVETKPWWDTVDHLAKCAGTTLLPREATRITAALSLADAAAARERMLEWSVDENFWTRRIAILCQLSLGEKTDPVLLADVIDANIGADADFSDEFFINKAIGWALRDYARHNPEWVKDFIAQRPAGSDHGLVKLSVREALKHL